MAALNTLSDCGAAQKPRLRRCDAASLTYLNRLAGSGAIAIPVCGESWHVALSPAPAAAAGAGSQTANWHVALDNSMLVVSMSADALQALFEACGCRCPCTALPRDLLLAIGQTILEDASEALHERGLGSLRLDRIGLGEAPPSGLRRIAWQAGATPNATPYHGGLYADAAGLVRIASLTNNIAASRFAIERWSDLPVPLTLELGYSILPLSDIRTLRTGDVVVADKSWSDKRGRSIALRISDRLIIQGEIAAGGDVTAASGIMDIPTDDDQAQYADSTYPLDTPVDNLDSLPVRMTFDLGERTVSFAELSSLQPGYVFDLGLQASQAVTLRANGVRIGEGELVEIDGRIGVSITRIVAPQAS